MQIILRLYQAEEKLISVPPPHAPPRPLPHFALPQPSSTPTSPALCSTSAFIHPDLSRTLLYLSLHPPRPLPHFALPQPSSTPTSPALCSTSAFIHPDLSRTLLYLSLHPPRPLPHFALPQPSSTPTSPALCSTSAFIFVSASTFPPSSFKGRKEAPHQISIEVVSEAVLGELLTDGAERTHAHTGIPQRVDTILN